MSKRVANTTLTHDNWNEETPAEEAGTFQVASAEEIKKRVMKTAKRRLADDSETPSTFAGFAGFGKSNATTGSAPSGAGLFAFLSTGAATKPATITTVNSSGTDANGHQTIVTPSANSSAVMSTKRFCGESGSGEATSNGRWRSEYTQQLRDLNESVSKWISSHVETNPCCILTPVFADYERHLRQIQAKRPPVATESTAVAAPCTQADTTHEEKVETKTSVFSRLGQSEPEVSAGANKMTEVTQASLFAAANELSRVRPSADDASQNDGSAKVKWPAFSATPVDATKFSFGLSAGKLASVSEASTGEETDDYEPPKNVVIEVKEEDSLYSVRCKLFYKKGHTYSEKGVGTLYLKSVNSKTQLLIRAETNLGNILLNIRLTADLPTQRAGKNNVTLVCVPNPPIDPKSASNDPVTFLIRVKNSEEAEELLNSLQTHKC